MLPMFCRSPLLPPLPLLLLLLLLLLLPVQVQPHRSSLTTTLVPCQLQASFSSQSLLSSPRGALFNPFVKRFTFCPAQPLRTPARFMCDAIAAVETAPAAAAAASASGSGDVLPDCAAFLRTFGSKGASIGQFNCPRLMTLDHEGNVVVVDKANHRLQVLRRVLVVTNSQGVCPQVLRSSDGVCLRTIGSEGQGAGQFNHPLGVAFDREGHVIVADFYNHRVQVLRYADGSHVRSIGRCGACMIRGCGFNSWGLRL